MKAVAWIGSLGLVVALAVAGCKDSAPATAAAKEYPIKGKVVAVDQSKPSVKLDHEAISELNMMAMTMNFDVENAKVLDGIAVGDEVQGQLKVESGRYVITRLTKR
jgi:Cu/Ag efflux protein CusF